MYGQIHQSVTSTNCRPCKNFACRIVSGARKNDHITPIRIELNWLPVVNQLYYHSPTMAFKCMAGHAPEYLSSKFLRRGEVSDPSTRNSQLLNILFFKTASGKRTFYYRIMSLWNSLDCLLNYVSQSPFLKFAWEPNYLKNCNFYIFIVL